ncbi:MAG: prephenate dehydrogenase/arogenate dehydrogenase family protein [Chloroflexota bacterium]|nr:prephenate dehydrogenase/arogenate dehydrogenase family protein [Chloroflexota bacterium]
MAKPKITIVGLGLIGNSIGLGLVGGKRDFEVVGHDKDNNAASQAKKMKAVDKTDWNLINATDDADLIILALPVSAIRSTLEALAPELQPGTVLLDTASTKGLVLAWADELLPPGVTFVGTNPIVSSEGGGGAAARADLFDKATWAICPTSTTSEAAVKMATDLAERLGANPLFLDATEHDGMMAAVEHLPATISMALISSVMGQPSWAEMRKLAGGQFENTTQLVSEDPAVFRSAIAGNQEHVLRWIDTYMENLQAWRDLIEAGDDDALAQAFESAVEARHQWQAERRTGHWEEPGSPKPAKRNMMMEMFGMGRFAERRQKKK